MENKLEIIAGIDLGTTYSCIACVDEYGRPNILKNFEGNSTTPSVIYFENEGSIIVGEEAKNNLRVSPEESVDMVKRSMGDPNYLFLNNGKEYRAEELSSFILKKLVQDGSKDFGQEITDVVITCPAYFGINEREATKKAGEIAGLNVRAVINEPTAAAIAYAKEQTDDKVILVYDLGGGTFDVTIISITQEKIEVIVTGGDHNLGGRNWDDEIVKYLAMRFCEENDSDDNLLDDPETLNELHQSAEKAKQTLTSRSKTTVVVQYDGERAKIELTKEKFEELTEGLLEKTITLTNDMLQEAKEKGVENFDELILVGGSSRMPMVATRLKEEYQKDPELHDPDEAVAKGAAIYGYRLSIDDELIKRISDRKGIPKEEVDLSEDSEEKEVAISEVAALAGVTRETIQQDQITINVTSKSFGVVAVVDDAGTEQLCNLIFKNDSLPAKCTERFGTFENNMESVLMRIMSSEVKDPKVDPSQGEEIGEAILSLPLGLPKNSPIDVTYHLDEHGMLHIEALELTDSRKVETTIETNSVISGEALEEAKERSKSIAIS